jgi:hypothetical protein
MAKKKKKESLRATIAASKRESFKEWTIIQKGLLVIFVLGVGLAIADMSCGTKETTSPSAPASSGGTISLKPKE